MPNFLEYFLGLKKKKNNLANKGNLPSLEDLKKEYIDYILEITLYNLSEAAKILDISRTTLYNKMNKYKITLPPHRRLAQKPSPLSPLLPEAPEIEKEKGYLN